MTAFTAKPSARTPSAIYWRTIPRAHQRMVRKKNIQELNETPPESWEQPESHIRVVHSAFPNLSIPLFWVGNVSLDSSIRAKLVLPPSHVSSF